MPKVSEHAAQSLWFNLLLFLLQIVLHPKWGSSVYPATMFARVPADRLMAAIREVDAELRSSTQ